MQILLNIQDKNLSLLFTEKTKEILDFLITDQIIIFGEDLCKIESIFSVEDIHTFILKPFEKLTSINIISGKVFPPYFLNSCKILN